MYVITHTKNKRTTIVGTCITERGANKAFNKLLRYYPNDAFAIAKTSSTRRFFFNRWNNKRRKNKARKRYEKLTAQYTRIGEMLMEYQDD